MLAPDPELWLASATVRFFKVSSRLSKHLYSYSQSAPPALPNLGIDRTLVREDKYSTPLVLVKYVLLTESKDKQKKESKANLISASISNTVFWCAEKYEEPIPFVMVSPKQNGFSSIKPCLCPFTYAVWPKTINANILLKLVCKLLRLIETGYHLISTTRNSYLAFWPVDTCKKSFSLRNRCAKLIIRNGPTVLMSSAASYLQVAILLLLWNVNLHI